PNPGPLRERVLVSGGEPADHRPNPGPIRLGLRIRPEASRIAPPRQNTGWHRSPGVLPDGTQRLDRLPDSQGPEGTPTNPKYRPPARIHREVTDGWAETAEVLQVRRASDDTGAAQAVPVGERRRPTGRPLCRGRGYRSQAGRIVRPGVDRLASRDERTGILE